MIFGMGKINDYWAGTRNFLAVSNNLLLELQQVMQKGLRTVRTFVKEPVSGKDGFYIALGARSHPLYSLTNFDFFTGVIFTFVKLSKNDEIFTHCSR